MVTGCLYAVSRLLGGDISLFRVFGVTQAQVGLLVYHRTIDLIRQ